MATLPITKLGDPILRKVSRTIDLAVISTSEFRRLVEDMIETMHAANGIGIAAPQVGVELQVAIINAKDRPFAIINPRITTKSVRKETAEEGCLSIPGVFGIVKRPKEITVTYIDEDGHEVIIKARGLMARVFQH